MSLSYVGAGWGHSIYLCHAAISARELSTLDIMQPVTERPSMVMQAIAAAQRMHAEAKAVASAATKPIGAKAPPKAKATPQAPPPWDPWLRSSTTFRPPGMPAMIPPPKEAKLAIGSPKVAKLATPKVAKLAKEAKLATPKEAKLATPKEAKLATPKVAKLATPKVAKLATPKEAKKRSKGVKRRLFKAQFLSCPYMCAPM